MTSAPLRSLEQTFGGATLRVEYRSITDVAADVLVSSDDTNLTMSGGVSLTLLRAGGESVLHEAQEQAPLPIGGVAVTTAGHLRAKKIFHPAVLDLTARGLASVELIRSVTRACLTKCDRLGLTSICFPALATGLAGLSPERSALAMLMEIAAYLGETTSIKTVSIALFPNFGVDRDETISRFFARITDFLELTRRLEGTTTAIEAMEQAYRQLGAEGEAESAASFRNRLNEHRTDWEAALSATEPGDTQRERGWLIPFEQMEADVLRMPIAPASRKSSIAPTQAPSAPSLQPISPGAPSPQLLSPARPPPPLPAPAGPAPAKSSVASERFFAEESPRDVDESEVRPRAASDSSEEEPSADYYFPKASPKLASPDDWAAIERRCKEERRGMLRALVAIRERDLVQLELDAALRSTAIDNQVMEAAQARLEWLKKQLVQLERELGAGGEGTSLLDIPGPSLRASATMLNILHLSDLHFGTEANAQSWYQQLTADLTQELGCERLDCVVLSGDIANRSTKAEYSAARSFLDRLCQRFGLAKDRLVIVPGNHDINWPLSEKAYKLVRTKSYKGSRDDAHVIDKGEFVEVRDDAKYHQRINPFRDFYQAVKGEPYPAEPAGQATIHAFADLGLVFLGLNSAWQLDHHYTKRAGVDPRALDAALGQLDRERALYRDCHKIAVWHHPLSSEYEDRIKDHGFLERLAVAGFRLTLHGHIHKAKTLLFHYDHSAGGRKIDVISAGTFGAPVHEWVPGYPLQYNLLRIQGKRVTVETRRREELEGAWKPDARWSQGAGKDPRPRYEIDL